MWGFHFLSFECLVKIHWRVLILECSQGCYGRTEGRKDGQTDGSVTISLRNFVGEGIKRRIYLRTNCSKLPFKWHKVLGGVVQSNIFGNNFRKMQENSSMMEFF
jgi:hypothetical protein